MVKKLFGTFAVATLLCVSVVMADEVKGKLTKVDPDKKTITVTKDSKDHDYAVADDCKMPPNRMGKGKEGGGDAKPMTLKDLEASLKRAKDRGTDGLNVALTVEKKDGKEKVTEIKIERGGRPKNPDK